MCVQPAGLLFTLIFFSFSEIQLQSRCRCRSLCAQSCFLCSISRIWRQKVWHCAKSDSRLRVTDDVILRVQSQYEISVPTVRSIFLCRRIQSRFRAPSCSARVKRSLRLAVSSTKPFSSTEWLRKSIHGCRLVISALQSWGIPPMVLIVQLWHHTLHLNHYCFNQTSCLPTGSWSEWDWNKERGNIWNTVIPSDAAEMWWAQSSLGHDAHWHSPPPVCSLFAPARQTDKPWPHADLDLPTASREIEHEGKI